MVWHLSPLIQAFLIGLVLAVPVGPMALLCIQRTLRFGFSVGLATSIGISLADALYGLVGILGLSAVSQFLFQYQMLLKISGGIFLAILGTRILRESRDLKKSGIVPENKGLWAAFISAFILTLSNPMTVLAYVAVMAGVQMDSHGVDQALILAGSVFWGSLLWWVFLSGLAACLKSKLEDRHMHAVGMVSGILLIVFAVLIVLSAF
ncbi:MAG: LysE family translocator [Myxococcaceae bacterium]|nr:LysE family translocator [Myxococcaceae bacterium]MBH2006757.1 LysE family translocator [Myxococcaceae bacterium]